MKSCIDCKYISEKPHERILRQERIPELETRMSHQLLTLHSSGILLKQFLVPFHVFVAVLSRNFSSKKLIISLASSSNDGHFLFHDEQQSWLCRPHGPLLPYRASDSIHKDNLSVKRIRNRLQIIKMFCRFILRCAVVTSNHNVMVFWNIVRGQHFLKT